MGQLVTQHGHLSSNYLIPEYELKLLNTPPQLIEKEKTQWQEEKQSA
jgi:hypothetical protein